MHAPRVFGAYGVTMVLGLFGATGLVQKCAPPAVNPPLAVSVECTDLVNAARAAAGVSPVTIHGGLNAVAEGHSNYQAQRKKMSHTGSNGSNAGQRITAQGYSWRTYGENVAAGQGDCPTVVTAWMNSAGHRANILNPAVTEIGVGAVTSTDGVIYWTMDLAAQR